MARRFGSTPFAEILPSSLAQDDCLKAIADSLDKILASAVPGIASLLIYARLAKAKPEKLLPPLTRLAGLCGGLSPLSEPLLDMLAWQFHVDGYEAAYDIEAKERMLLQSLMLHRRKGTPWAVRNALMAAFGTDAGISEWFRYGGKPYFFRAWLDVSGLFWDQEATPNALRLINEYKNVRSWLEYFTTRASTPLYAHVGIASRTLTRSRHSLWFVPCDAPALARNGGVAISARTVSRQRFWFAPAPYAGMPRRIAACASGRTAATLRLFFPAGRIQLATRQALCAHGITMTKIFGRQHA